jgi:hypothetical protein
MHQATACLAIARNACGVKGFGFCASCSASCAIARTAITIWANGVSRSCSAATFSFMESRSALTNAKSLSSSCEMKSPGTPAIAMGESFNVRPGGEKGVASSAGILPHHRGRSEVRAGGNVPQMIIAEPVIKPNLFAAD